MDDNRIEIVASLDIPKSISTIKEDLKVVAERLNSEHALKIIGNLDLPQTTRRIQSQLATINKDLKLDLGKINVGSNVESVVTDIQNSLANTKVGTSIKVETDIKAINDIHDDLEKLGVDANNIQRLTDYFKQLDVIITKIKPKFVELSGTDAGKVLDSLTISGVDKKTGNVVTIVDQLDNIEGKVAKTTTTITQNLAKVEQANKKIEDTAKAAQIAYNDFLKSQGTADVYLKKYGDREELQSQFETIQRIMSEFDNTQPVEKQREVVIKLDNELKKIKVDIDAINKAKSAAVSSTVNDYYPDIAKIVSADKSSKSAQLDAAKSTLNTFFGDQGVADNANRIKRAVEDTTGELQRFYVQVEKGDKSVETLTYALNEQGDAYTYLGKTIREADNSTAFRRHDIATQWAEQTEKLKAFISKAEKAGAASTVLGTEITNLKAKLAEGGDTSAMNAFLDDFDIAKAKLAAFNAEATKNNAIQNLSNRIRKLATDVNTYAESNKRAIESTKTMANGNTFASQWESIMSRMAKGANLSDREVKNLTTDLAIFKKEAQAAGLTGATAFEKFANAFKLVSTYISANQIINTITRQIRSAVSELQSIDDILTEISKTSDRTSESIRTLGKNSFDVASSYGRTASDYLLGVQEMSRAGFGEKQSENLAELSLKAQAAGDMTAEMANQYIIATNAAYNLEGSEQKLNAVLDSQNYITNRNALNMEGLAEATKIAASQAAAAGVDIDEMTAAVGTMMATTQQGGEIAGRAFKGILMNIAQVKADAADIGDGGESITTESLSKYEAATKALGVSLKEVKNGVWTLRDPMQVLKELSIAVKNEAEDSIKVANLISSVGGKYRGNQLIALLKNWESYEKMPSEFNSENAIGSAAEEAAKSANNWSGSINKLKNSWAKLVEQFVNSDVAINILNSINSIIQNVSSSSTLSALGVLTKSLSELVSLLGKVSNYVGSIPTILGAIAAVRSIKGKGFINIVADDADKANKELVIFGKKFKDIQAAINASNATGLNKITAGLKAINVGAIAAKAAVVALNAVATMGVSFAIEKITSFIDGWVNREKIAAQKAEELRAKQEELRRQTIENAEAYKQSETELGSLIAQYVKLASSVDNLESVKSDLSQLQDQIIDKYGQEAEGIDLVNNSLRENIRLMVEAQEKENSRWLVENSEAISNAEDFFYSSELGYHKAYEFESPMSFAFEDMAKADGERYITAITEYLQEHYPDIADSIITKNVSGDVIGFKVLDTLDYEKQVEAVNAIVKAYEYGFDQIGDTTLFKSNAILQVMYDWQKKFQDNAKVLAAKSQHETDKAIFDSIGEDAEKRYLDLIDNIKSAQKDFYDENATVADKFKASLDLDKYMAQLKEFEQEYPAVGNIIESALSELGITIDNVTGNFETAKEAWVKSLDEAQKGVLSDVDKITSAMEKLYAGEGIDQKSAWEILNMDDDKVLSNIKIVDGKYVFDLEQIVSLKDQIIQKEIEQRKESIATAKEGAKQAKDNIALAKQRMLAVTLERGKAYASGNTDRVAELNAEYKSLENSIQKDTDALNGFNYTIRNETLYVEQLSGSLGDLTDTADVLQAMIKRLQKELEALNKKADGMLKAQEHVIDGIIDKYEDELDVLEKQQDSLEEQLDVLEKQKDELDDIIDKYKTVSNYVQDTISKQIEEIEDNRKEIEDYYDNLIDKLKTENEEREDAIEYEKKLAALNNAKNNKVRSYDQARGWTYEANKDAIQDAQNDLDSFENEQAIKELEKQKEEATAGFDERIKELEAYSKEWKDAIDGITEAENDLIATEILGSDWREKIAKRDEETLTKFKTVFSKYNTDLAKLTKNEIENLKSSIQAVKDEVTEKKKQIQVWKDYKTELTSAASDIKNGLEDYVKYLDTVKLTENSTNADRLTNLQNFKNSYSTVVAEIVSKNAELESVEEHYDNIVNAMKKVMSITGGTGNVGGDIGNALASAINFFAEKIKELKDVLDPLKTAFKIVAERAEKIKDTDKGIEDILGFAGGGAADYTGLAMLHGTKQKSETIFTAAQSKKLLSLVEAMPDYSKLLSTPPRVEANKTTTNNIAGATFSIANMTVVANNPEQFEAQMKRYWQTKLTESKVY